MIKLKKSMIRVMLIVLIVVLSSCDFFYKATDKIFPAPTTATTSAATESKAPDATKRPAQIITDVPTTEPPKTESLFIDLLKSELNGEGDKIVFLFDGNDDGVQELFVVTAFASRCICDVYYAENGKLNKAINGYEVFTGAAEEYYVGIAKRSGDHYLSTYSKTRYSNEYTVRYTFIDLKSAETSTVAEDYRSKDGSTGKSVHEYMVNGESATENQYIVARESYSLICATEKTEKDNVEKVGVSVQEMITELGFGI